ncbi:MAG TPA: hypothetical protein VMW27_02560, partial [Thermoanaerobaculia bacterium]|nr:hypothetical protein [Thermoanaerobaculia bacterium]
SLPESKGVQEILRSIPEAPQIDEKALAAAAQSRDTSESAGGVEIPDFEAIYRAAGISDPPHGFSAYKVLEILSSPELAALDGKAKAAALSGFLKMNPRGPVPLAEVIQDAVRRDQALDKFEQMLRAKLAGRAEEIERENAKLQAEIDELARRNRELMEANRREVDAEQEQLSLWLTRKRIEERRLFDAVGPFVEENPISTERPADPGPQT